MKVEVIHKKAQPSPMEMWADDFISRSVNRPNTSRQVVMGLNTELMGLALAIKSHVRAEQLARQARLIPHVN